MNLRVFVGRYSSCLRVPRRVGFYFLIDGSILFFYLNFCLKVHVDHNKSVNILFSDHNSNIFFTYVPDTFIFNVVFYMI